MNLKDILSISGEPGLFKFIAQGRNAIIVEHLETKKRKTASGSAKVSSLEDISIFTEKEDLPLGKVFDLIFEKEKGGQAIDSKSDAVKLKVWFEMIMPEYDKDRVYVSDMKKVVTWYNILQKLSLLVKDEPEDEKNKESDSEKKIEKKSKPKAAPKPKTKPTGKTESKAAAPLSKGRPNSK
jgi:cell division septation protein DedD